jgi:hypothetical protein
MTRDRFEAMMITLVPGIVSSYRTETGATWEAAVHDLYTSKLYGAIEDQNTALWHLSPVLLADLLREERNKGNVLLPEEQ